MGALTHAALVLPFKSTVLQLRAADRPCAVTSQQKLKLRSSDRMTHIVKRKQVTSVGTTPITRNCKPTRSSTGAGRHEDAEVTEELYMMTQHELESDHELDVYCDIMTDSMTCQKLQSNLYPASRMICEEAEADAIILSEEFVVLEGPSKKPLRLSSTSRDLLD